MTLYDVLQFGVRALGGYPLRTVLMLAATAIGVAAVIVLTALGDGARRYVTGEFSALGTNLLIVLPGRSETTGGPPPLLGETPRDLTLDDALALERSRYIQNIAPVVVGVAPVSWRAKERDVTVVGSTADLFVVRNLEIAQGRSLPAVDATRAVPVCVLGAQVRAEVFGPHPALGEWVRLGERRFRVVGILASQGQSIGLDLSDMVVVPVASAQMLFDSPALFRILLSARSQESLPLAKEHILETIRLRHDGEDDVTVITQDAVISTFDRILRALTLTVGGIASISLLAAGLLIMNVMLIAVSQRTAEIGLLKALGASPRKILLIFLCEAALLAASGGLVGILVGHGGSWLVRRLYPMVPAWPPTWAIFAALGMALGAGIVFGGLPASRAARLDPVEALAPRG